MIKALKKLKVWSRNKKKKRKTHALQPSPPPALHCSCCYCSNQPSAPPLPSWVDFDQTQEPASVSGLWPPSGSDPPASHTHQFEAASEVISRNPRGFQAK
ncbi:PREDICTED: uncharacterized protein LOC104603195 isoform X2 [Nelumbo nucifera]|nr:PREDICTED: uncharacterized protein LOC104603195 isoform X2 [Nelumbo nucifera]